MKIAPDKCIACLECIDFCPMNCIAEGDDGVVRIDQDECVECGVCHHVGVCPTDAIFLPEEAKVYPRALRAQFSDPGVQHPSTNQGGRGTEEMKTNDVTGRFRRGEFGMALEFGRPGTGARMTDLEKVLQALMKMDVELEHENAVFAFLEKPLTGKVKPEFRNEKVLSAILEFKIREEQLNEVVRQNLVNFGSSHAGKSLKPHITFLSLGVHGKRALLSEDRIQQITTMCGHGLVSSKLSKAVIKRVKAGKMTPEAGADLLAQPCCPCGIFNTDRCTAILNECRRKSPRKPEPEAESGSLNRGAGKSSGLSDQRVFRRTGMHPGSNLQVV